jgi:hypothetical protein
MDNGTPTLAIGEEVVSCKGDNPPDVAVKSLVLSAVRKRIDRSAAPKVAGSNRVRVEAFSTCWSNPGRLDQGALVTLPRSPCLRSGRRQVQVHDSQGIHLGPMLAGTAPDQYRCHTN